MARLLEIEEINRRLARLGSAVMVLAGAGVDDQRHRLVSVACSRCGAGTEFNPGSAKTMRLSDLNRVKKGGDSTVAPFVKSCGCLKAFNVWKYYSDKTSHKSGAVPKQVISNPIFEEFAEAGYHSPRLICLLVARSGRYKPLAAYQAEHESVAA